MTNKELLGGVGSLLQDVRDNVGKSPVVFKATREMHYSIIQLCVDVIDSVGESDENKRASGELLSKYFEAEKKFVELRSFWSAWPYYLIVLTTITVVCLLFKYLGVYTSLVSLVFGVQASEKLVVLGIFGAFIYLLTSLILKTERERSLGSPWYVANFFMRVLLATVVPVVLVVLLFSNDGKFNEVKMSPELLSFGFGYSANLVIEFLNKIVEKGSNVIKSL